MTKFALINREGVVVGCFEGDVALAQSTAAPDNLAVLEIEPTVTAAEVANGSFDGEFQPGENSVRSAWPSEPA